MLIYLDPQLVHLVDRLRCVVDLAQVCLETLVRLRLDLLLVPTHTPLTLTGSSADTLVGCSACSATPIVGCYCSAALAVSPTASPTLLLGPASPTGRSTLVSAADCFCAARR